METRGPRRWPLVCAAGLMLAASGCQKGGPGATTGPAAAPGQKVTLGFLVKKPDEAWFQNEWRFAQEYADKHGVALEKLDGSDGEKVLSAIDTLNSKGARGFVICTPDPKLGPAIMARADRYGMKVISVDDQFVGSDGRFMDVPYVGISARQIGEEVGKALWAEMQKRGWKVEETAACAVTFDELDTVKQRTDGATEALVKAGFPADRIYRAPEKTTDQVGATDAASVLLTQRPGVKRWLVYSVNDEGVLGAVRAMESRGPQYNAQTVIGIGIGGPSAVSEFQQAKPTGFFATVVISPKRHGYETTEMLYRWVTEGRLPPKDTRTSGELATRATFERVMRNQGQI